MMRGYKAAMQDIEYGKGYSDDFYTEKAQTALDAMAIDIQCFALGGPCVTPEEPAATPGFEITGVAFTIVAAAMLVIIQRKRKR
jgi:hypothetical protein